jgi:hypothetical protein
MKQDEAKKATTVSIRRVSDAEYISNRREVKVFLLSSFQGRPSNGENHEHHNATKEGFTPEDRLDQSV